MTRGHGAGPIAALMALAISSAASTLHAQGPRSAGDACDGNLRVANPHPWPAPLDRRVTLRSEDTSLRAALDHVASSAPLRLSYSPDLLPLARAACVVEITVPAGDALVALLVGTGVSPVPAGGDLVVLAPSRTPAASAAAPLAARPARQLERVVVTGTAAGTVRRASPFALSIIEPDPSTRTGTISLAELLDGAAPGVWLWSQNPTSATSRFGSVRGASSFGATAPKVYIDGVEVANPLLVTQIDPARVASIEVIRGPQGAALYGADAISGVVNIATRHDAAPAGGTGVEARASGGAAGSDYASETAMAQDYGLVLRRGGVARATAFGASFASLGPYLPGAAVRRVLASGSGRWIGTRAIVTSTARFYGMNADAPLSPLLRAMLADADTTPASERARQYSLGATATLHGSARWTHVAIAGVDGYRLGGFSTEDVPVPSAADSALRAARGGADRASLRLSSTRRLGAPERRAATVTLGAEHSTARERTNGAGTLLFSADTSAVAEPTVSWWHSSGVLAQGELSLRNAAFLSAGARLERIAGPASDPSWSLLPMLGASWVRERGDVSLKLRGAYGRGIRPARSVLRGASWTGRAAPGAPENTSLAPEEQAGIEAGADLFWGRRLGLHVTRFDQRAKGLVQAVAVIDSARRGPGGGPGGPGGMGGPRVSYLLQNVGEIDNDGWELEASATPGALRLAATATRTSSRVARVSSGYQGDLRAGDRMLEVPAHTLGLSATWTTPRLAATASIARAMDWINYDRVALVAGLADSTATDSLPDGAALGERLRQYWRTYDGVTRVGARVSVALPRGLSLLVSGENLLDAQTGEPDNVTVLPGRTLAVGVRARLR